MKSSSVDPRPALASQRLRGEPVEPRHAVAMASVLQDPEIFRFLDDDPPSVEHLERQYGYLRGGKSPDGAEHWLTWILVPNAPPTDPIGFVQATVKEPESVHVAYVLNPRYWGRGYAREAVGELLNVVFAAYRVQRAVAEMDTRNQASIALVRALGFSYEKTVESAAHFKGASGHEHVYVLARGDWLSRSNETHR